MMRLSFVVTTKNSEDRIDGVVKNCLEIGDEVIVVDDHSNDRTKSIAERNGARIVELDIPFDHSSARNIGADNASGRYIFQLDDDERIDPQYKERILRLIDEETRYNDVIQTSRNGRGYDFTLQSRFYKREGTQRFIGESSEWLYPIVSNDPLNIQIMHSPQKDYREKLQYKKDLLEKEMEGLLEKDIPESRDDLITRMSRYRLLYQLSSVLERSEYGTKYHQTICDKLKETHLAGMDAYSDDELMKYELALTFIDFCDDRRALEILTNGTELVDKSSGYLYMVSALYARSGKTSKAIVNIELSIEKSESFMNHYLRMQLYCMVGDSIKARESIQKMKEIFPDINI